MGSILLFSVVAAIAAAVIIVPLTSAKGEEEKGKSLVVPALLFTAVIGAIVIALAYYFLNIDRNLTSLWPVLAVAAGLGALFSKGLEQKAKSVLFGATLLFAAYLFAAPLLNADEKFKMVEMDEEVEIEAFDETQTPASVPPKFARNKMKKAFGQVPNTSYYELGQLQVQKVNEEFVYIAPVEFSGFFKWWNADVTPGYFTMSATDASANPKFIQSEMSYTPSSYFNKNIERHMRLENPEAIFYGEVQLEVDDEGKPYYIRSYGDFVTARNGFDVKGIVAIDPSSGESITYKLEDVPAFIDGAVSPESVSLENSYYGNYVHGFWNSKFGKKDVKLPSDEGTEANVSPIFDADGEMYYFTDFTSPKEGVDSMLGYSLTNARSGKSTYFTGSLEDSYMDSQGNLQIIEKQFIEKEWSGEMPVLYNFYGEASWLTPVLDSNGFLQNYFIVSAANPEISVYAGTPNEALKLYKTALQRGGSTVDGSSEAEEAKTSGVVERVFKERVGDFTSVSFLLEDGTNYIVSSENVPLAIYLEENDQVNMTYFQTGDIFLPVKELVIEGVN
ncbi:sulfite exporter TauE/SafE family protein [Planococcus sp. 107-1]|uniref:sulfite exporter TauE/SafE family protein n=1 Tax=Planococcus sp. 107-1 TaxID=2908840 RepID=UPI001F29397D|nr:sulfite exporter TauE/SafE family protein [Planococcus sp. 107-1]UJF27314.1 sulfite exporter TauE/SafE family protein [Planococcus sp. 107-1]